MADQRCPHGFSGSVVYCPNADCPSHDTMELYELGILTKAKMNLDEVLKDMPHLESD